MSWCRLTPFVGWLEPIAKNLRDRNENSAEVRIRSRMYIGLIDVVFGVVVGVSFMGVPATWSSPLSFRSISLIIAYAMVVLSWVGYHRAIGPKPHKAWFRFAIDLALLFVYFILVNFPQFPNTVLSAYLAMFSLYVLWEYIKAVEYKEPLKATKIRIAFPAAVGLILLGLLALEKSHRTLPQQTLLTYDYLSLAAIVVIRVLYILVPGWEERAKMTPLQRASNPVWY